VSNHGQRTLGASAPQRAVIDAFLAASRHGDFTALLALLDPDVVLRADSIAVQAGATPEIRGAQGVAQRFSGGARAARTAIIDGVAGAVWAERGRPRAAFSFTIVEGKVTRIDIVMNPERLAQMDVAILNE
jgi:ketosteroid isomerase-like protein